jgi:flagellar biosynthetic protein FlhB
MVDDFLEKTEEATYKKLKDARGRGFVAKSQDISIAISLLLITAFLYFYSDHLGITLSELSISIFSHLSYAIDKPENAVFLIQYLTNSIFFLLLPIFFATIFFAIFGNVIQIGFLFSSTPLSLKWNKINIFSWGNYENHFGVPAVIKGFLSLGRLNVVLVMSAVFFHYNIPHIMELVKKPPIETLKFILSVDFSYIFAISFGYLLIACVDYAYQKWRYKKMLRMSHREIKDELKQTEGDLKFKSKIRNLMQEQAKPFMKKLIHQTDFLVTDGDYFAVALSYKDREMAAPVCILKGMGQKAHLIKTKAKENQIPIIENSRLAQSLFKSTPTDKAIKPEFYRQIAQIMTSIQKD